MRNKTTENFREYAIRWREQAARVKQPMKESEMIDVFLQAQEPDYFHYLLSAVGKTFAEVIKVGEMVKWHQVWEDCKSSCLKSHNASASKWFWKYWREEEKGGCGHYCISA